MGIARLMAPPAAPLIKPTAAPPSTPRMLTPPMIMTTEAARSSAEDAEDEDEEAVETTPLNVNERETHFGGTNSVGVVGGASEVSGDSGNGHPRPRAKRMTSVELLNPSSANCLAPVAAASAAVGSGGSPGGTAVGGGLSVSQRVRRVSMAMSIASEGKNGPPSRAPQQISRNLTELSLICHIITAKGTNNHVRGCLADAFVPQSRHVPCAAQHTRERTRTRERKENKVRFM